MTSSSHPDVPLIKPSSAASSNRRQAIDVKHLNRGIIYGNKRAVSRATREEKNVNVTVTFESVANVKPAEEREISHDVVDHGIDIDDDGYDTDLDADDDSRSFDHSGRAAYLDACRLLNVIPVSFFLRHMKDTLLDMKHHGLGPVNVRPIAMSLITNSNVTAFNLKDNYLGPTGCRIICDMLTENCYITNLDLTNNHLDHSSCVNICRALRVNTTITHLELAGNELDDKCAPPLAEMVLVRFVKIDNVGWA